ncbi:hypothetical protein ES706_05989 [subsurface metagenome]
MRRSNLVMLLVAAVVFLLGGPYEAARATEEITVTVQGKGSLRVTPDLALLYMGVEVTAPHGPRSSPGKCQDHASRSG